MKKLREANERTLVIALIETTAGIADAEAIMGADGIDIGWLAACAAHGKPAGIRACSVETAEAWRARGFRIFAYGTDISLLQQSLRSGLTRLREGESQ